MMRINVRCGYVKQDDNDIMVLIKFIDDDDGDDDDGVVMMITLNITITFSLIQTFTFNFPSLCHSFDEIHLLMFENEYWSFYTKYLLYLQFIFTKS